MTHHICKYRYLKKVSQQSCSSASNYSSSRSCHNSTALTISTCHTKFKCSLIKKVFASIEPKRVRGANMNANNEICIHKRQYKPTSFSPPKTRTCQHTYAQHLRGCRRVPESQTCRMRLFILFPAPCSCDPQF